MIYPIKIDLFPLLKNLVAAIQPYANANNIQLQFQPVKEQIEIYHHPEFIIPELTKLICRIIAFTPQDFDIELELQRFDYGKENIVILNIKNSGANLGALKDAILNGEEQFKRVKSQELFRLKGNILLTPPLPIMDRI
jgi:hypothetical protein